MSTAPRLKPFTFDDFCVLVKDGEKADLINGVIYMASPDNTDANKLSVWFGGLLDLYVEEKEYGQLFYSLVALRLDDFNSPEPDIFIILKDRLHLVKRGFIAGRADLAVEIVSPESEQRDYEKKRALYERAGIPEYWIINEIHQKVALLRLTSKGTYREVRPKKGEFHSQVLPGFWFRPEWLWQDPRPKKRQILEQILTRES
jgi:Uma2 family endonuclease